MTSRRPWLPACLVLFGCAASGPKVRGATVENYTDDPELTELASALLG
jgi:hypothetical protein